MGVAGPRMVAVGVRHHRPRHRFGRVDVEPARLAIEPGHRPLQPVLRARRRDVHADDISKERKFRIPGESRCRERFLDWLYLTIEIGLATASKGRRSAGMPIASSTTAAPIIS